MFRKPSDAEALAVEERLKAMITRGEERGRDSFGMVILTRDSHFRIIKERGPATQALRGLKGFIDRETSAIIINNRAEPTTEYVIDKSLDDVQPMVGEYIAVTHNGLIANDKELTARFGLERKSTIDTAVLPPLLEKAWDGTAEGLRDVLRLVVGSFALGIIDRRRPGRLWLATNFKPLYVMWDQELGALFFASMDKHLGDPNAPPWASGVVKKIKPYTLVEVGDDYTWHEVTLRETRGRRVLVVASGGLDSTTAATYLLRQGYEVTLLHFNYGHVAEDPEARAVRRIADHLGVPLIEVSMDFFRIVRHSPLLGEGEINRFDNGRSGAEFAHEWVPARNLVFTALAVAFAEAYGYDYVALGINLEEGGAYPDNEMEFIKLLNEVMPYAVGPNRSVELLMPVGNLVKHEIVKLGLEVGAPLHLTWSCYDKGPKHCGRCGPCFMRRWAFKINGVRDPVEYDLPEEIEEEFWKGTKRWG